MLTVGQAFPSFSLPDADGEVVTNEDLRGGPVVLYFYPKDDTSGCTMQACAFQERLETMPGARVVGVSPDGSRSHRKFADKYHLGFTLLADTDHALSQECGVWVEKSMYGKTYMGIARTTFLLDADGVVTHVFETVRPQGHAEEVATALAATAGP